MNAWTDDLGGLPIRSIALPRNGGVLNPDTKGQYSVTTTNLDKRFKAEEKRLRAIQAQAQPAPALATNVVHVDLPGHAPAVAGTRSRRP